MDEFFAFTHTENVTKTQTLLKRLEKHLNTIENGHTQVMDAIRILKMTLSELEADDFQTTFYIVAPVLERLEYTKRWSVADTRLASRVVGYSADYVTAHLFAQRVVAAMESNPKDFDQWQLLFPYINVLYRLLRAKFYDLDHTQNTTEMAELTTLFDQYTRLVLELCGDMKELEVYKVVVQIRSDLFHRNLTAVDEGLGVLRSIRKDVYTCICRQIISYNKYAELDITRLQLQVQVGLQLRKIREKANLTQEEMADVVGLGSASAALHIETGKQAPHIHSLFLLAKKMNISTDELLGLKD